jgi:hypothetical protein
MESLCTKAAGDGNGDGITGTELRALIIITHVNIHYFYHYYYYFFCMHRRKTLKTLSSNFKQRSESTASTSTVYTGPLPQRVVPLLARS